jgi:probable rRNA maturation factor
MPQNKNSVRKYGRARKAGPTAPRRPAAPLNLDAAAKELAPWDMQIKVSRRVPKVQVPAFRKLTEAILRDLEQFPPLGVRSRGMKRFPPPSVRQISVSLIGDKEMKVLNSAYRGKDKPTDVLSFAALEGLSLKELSQSGVEYTLGDLVISLDTAVVQAKRYRWSESEEILRLLIHGILHLLGYDHEGVSPLEAQLMRRVEKRLFGRHRGAAPTLLSSASKPSARIGTSSKFRIRRR